MKRTLRLLSASLLAAAFLFVSCSNETAKEEPKAVDMHLTAMGMKCESCKETIETTFMKMPGVDSVYADHMTKDVFVRVDTSQTSYNRLEDLISELGFDYIHDGEEL